MTRSTELFLKKMYFLTLSILLLLPFSLFSQTQLGIVSGEVRDAATKQPLPYSSVRIVGTQLGTSSNERGYFSIKNVPPGTYEVQATVIGYITRNQVDIIVSPSRNKVVNFDLSVSEIELSGVSIQADYFQKSADRAVSIKSLTPQEIRRSPGSAEDIFRVMQSLPGVATAGGKSAQLIVRGGSPDENLTLLDHVKIYNPIHFARTGESMGIISIVNPSLLKQVDFLTGGFPAQYGDKLSSVFEMTLQDGNKELLNTDVNTNVAGFGVMVDGPIPGNGSMVFSARRGFLDLITALLDRPAAPRYYDAVGKATYDLNENNRVSLVGFYYLDQIERIGTMKEAVTSKYDYLKRDDYGTAVGVNWRSLFSQKGYALTTVSLSSNGWTTQQGLQTNPTLKGDDILENEYGIKTEIVYQLSNSIELKTGGDVAFIQSKHKLWSPQDTARNGQLIPATLISYNPAVSKKYSTFAQSTFHPWLRLAITTGLRLDHFTFTNETNYSPRLSAVYSLTENTSLTAAYGTFYQTPAAYQIALDPVNQKLKSSLSTHYILGFEQRLAEDAKATVEIYHKELTQVIIENDTTDILNNAGSGYARGIEFYLQKKFTDGIVGSASYSYSISKRRDVASGTLYDFDYDRPHIINLIAGMSLDETWQIGAKFMFATGNPYTPVIGTANKNGGLYYVINGERNSVRYPDYHRLDIRVDKKFIFESWSLTAYLDLWNVYNRENVISYSYKVNSDGTIARSTKPDFGITPILGITTQF